MHHPAGRRKLAGRLGADKLRPLLLDLAGTAADAQALAGCAAAVRALPHGAAPPAIRTAMEQALTAAPRQGGNR